MKQTNKQIFDHLMILYRAKEQEFIYSQCGILPASLFTIAINFNKYPQGYFIEELKIQRITVRTGIYDTNKPTNYDIQKLKQFLNNPEFNKDEICVLYIAGIYSGGVRYVEISNGITQYAWTKSELEPKLEQMINDYSPKEGYEICAYCRKQRKPEDLIKATIFSPNWKSNGCKSPPRSYCKNSQCHINDQMAHEG